MAQMDVRDLIQRIHKLSPHVWFEQAYISHKVEGREVVERDKKYPLYYIGVTSKLLFSNFHQYRFSTFS